MKQFTPILLLLVALLWDMNANAQDLWQLLSSEPAQVQLMENTASSANIVFIASKRSQSQIPEALNKLKLPVPDKWNLFIFVTDKREKVLWKQTYTQLPEVNEIFSFDASKDAPMCLVYQDRPGPGLLPNPILVQIDNQKRVKWAHRLFSTENNLINNHLIKANEQIANLDTIQIKAIQGHCVVAYITRNTRKSQYSLHLRRYTETGVLKWEKRLSTNLYGKLFLIKNSKLTVVSTNISRDAAMKAMLEGRPYVVTNTITQFDMDGNLLNKIENLASLAKMRIKQATARNKMLYIVGEHNNMGKIIKFNDNFKPLAKHISSNGPMQSFLVTGDRVLYTNGTSIWSNNLALNKPEEYAINDTTVQQYSNPFLDARLPENLPVQDIVPLSEHSFLFLYQFGKRLVKIHLSDKTDL